MGNAVSRVYGSIVKRPLQRYNVETRAEKVITKTEDPTSPPKRAPMFDADLLAREEAVRNNKSIHKIETDLLDRLKVVYVDSKDPPTAPDSKNEHYAEFVPAQMRVERPGQKRTVPVGKVSLDQSVSILTKYKESGGKVGAADISKEYKLNKEVAGNIVKHFEIFNMMETTTREFETDRPDPLQAGKDWVDSRKTIDAEMQQEAVSEINAAKENLKKRIEKEAERKQLKD